jgi:hypothetical protein
VVVAAAAAASAVVVVVVVVVKEEERLAPIAPVFPRRTLESDLPTRSTYRRKNLRGLIQDGKEIPAAVEEDEAPQARVASVVACKGLFWAATSLTPTAGYQV